MAKVTGPFMSIDASGTFAKTLTASKWKGRNYMRQRVIPSNPQTAGQLVVRSVLGTIAKAVTTVLTSYSDVLGVGSAFFVAARDFAPANQSWVSQLQKLMYPQFATLRTTYLALSSTIRGYYDTTAVANGLEAYTDVDGNVQTTGFQLYLLGYFATINLGYVMTGGINNPTDQTEVDDFGDYVHLTS